MKDLITLTIGYIVISALIGIVFLLSSNIHSLIIKKTNQKWIENTYILSALSLLIVLILKIFYKDTFSIIGEIESLKRYIVILQIVIAAFPAAVLAYLAHPKQKTYSLKIDILTGMAMEIPMRALVQNLFIVSGATTVLFYSVPLSIVLTSIIWVQFIIVQEFMKKRPLSSKVIFDSIASVWCSIWVGIIYLTTGSIIIAMITHGLERWIAYTIRKSRIAKINIESRSC